MSRKDLRIRRTFLISGLSDNVRKELATKIIHLGGVYLETDCFNPSCTHVISGKLSRGEKFLGACAMGKWVMVPEYIRECAVAGKWLAEDKYEWSKRWDSKGDHSAELLSAPSRWRKACATSKRGAFFNWKVAIVIDNVKRKSVYKRLLESGGAKVLKLSPLTKSSERLIQILTHVLVNEDNSLTSESLMREGFPCYPPNYLGDFLIGDSTGKKSDVIIKAENRKINTKLSECSRQNSKTSSNVLSQEISTRSIRSFYSSRSDSPISSQKLGNKSCLNIFDSPQSISLFSSENGGLYSSDVSPRLSPLDNSVMSNRRLKQELTVPKNVSNKKPRSDRIRKQVKCSDTSDCFVSSFNVCVNKKSSDYSVSSSVKTEKGTSSINTSLESESNLSYFSSDSGCSTKGQPELYDDEVSIIAIKRCSVRLGIKCLSQLSSLKPHTRSTVSSKSLSTNSNPSSQQFENRQKRSLQSNFSRSTMQTSDLLVPGNYSERLLSDAITSRSSVGFTDWSNSSSSTSPSCFNKTLVRIKKELPVSVKVAPTRQSTLQKYLGANLLTNNSMNKKPQTRSRFSSKSFPTNSDSTSPGLESRLASGSLRSTPNSIRAPTNSTRSSDLLLQGNYSDSLLSEDNKSRSDDAFTDWSNIRGTSSTCSDISSFSTSPSNFNTETDQTLARIKKELPVSVKIVPATRRSERRKYPNKKYVEKAAEPASNMSNKSSVVANTQSVGIKREKEAHRNLTSTIDKFFPTSSDISSSLNSGQRSENKRSNHKGADCDTPSGISLKPAVRAVKREIFKSIDSPETNLPAKRQKVSHDPLDWHPTMFGVLAKRRSTIALNDEATPIKKRRVTDVSLPMNVAATGIVDTCLEDDFVSPALGILIKMVSSNTYPQPRIMHLVMTRILRDSTSRHQSNRAYVFLRSVLSKHPPQPDKPDIREFYLRSLRPHGTEDCCPGLQRQFIMSVISCLVCGTEDVEENPVSQENDTLLLQYLVAMLETDLANLLSSKNGERITVRDLKSSLLGEVFWPGSQQISLDKHCKGMLDFLTESLELLKTDQNKIVLVDLILKIISMLAQCLKISDQTVAKPKEILKGDRVSSLVYELARRLVGVPESILNITLARLSPAWLGLGVCSVLLDAMDDSLLHDNATAGEITLTRIVTLDMYLLPPLVRKPDSPIKSSNSKLSKARLNTEHKSFSVKPATMISSPNSSSTPRRGSVKAMLNKVNKRNGKGETTLHTACSRNNVTRVKELLAIQGIDVNIGDNYGWTALHEASSRGNVGCVTELLKYRPARTISSYFGTGEKGNRTNLLAGNHEGVTPLHDAVLNNRLEVAHILLQYGGHKLLESRTSDGDTPLSLCNSEEMRSILTTPGTELLSTPRKMRRAFNMSQGSQDSQSSFLFSQETPSEKTPSSGRPPSSETYQRILGEGTAKQYRSLEECLKYMCLLQHTVRLYVTLHQLSQHALKRKVNKLIEDGKKIENTDTRHRCKDGSFQHCASYSLTGQSERNNKWTSGDEIECKCASDVKTKNGKLSGSEVNMRVGVSEIVNGNCPSQFLSGKCSSRVNMTGSSGVLTDQYSSLNCSASFVNSTVSNELDTDLQVYLKLGKYLEGFRLHLKQISTPEDYRQLKPRLILWLCLCF